MLRYRNTTFVMIVVALVALVLGGCPASPAALFSPPEVVTPPIHEITFTATDTAFRGPESVPAGWTRITLANEGTSPAFGQLVRLPEDKSPADLAAAMETGEAPDWLAYAGGPTLALPGMSMEAVVNLQAGTHIIVNMFHDAEGVPGMARGQVLPFAVTPTEEPLAAEPQADITIDMQDYSFELMQPLSAGTYTFRVENSGHHAHEAILVQLAPGATAQDFLAAVAPDAPPGPPPGMVVGGFQVIDSGEYGFFNADIEPGNYALICFHPDPAPHFVLGMVKELTVE